MTCLRIDPPPESAQRKSLPAAYAYAGKFGVTARAFRRLLLQWRRTRVSQRQRIGGAPVRRFLLDLDLSVLVPGFPEVVTYLDLDGGTPSPDLAVRITPHSIDADDTYLEIHLEAVDGRPITDAEVRIFFNSDLGPNLDADPDEVPFPDPSHWVYMAYRADPGQTMPPWLDIDLSQTSFPKPAGLLAADDVGITLRCAEVTGPLHVEGGLLEGAMGPNLATTTTFVDGVYDEQPDVAMHGSASMHRRRRSSTSRSARRRCRRSRSTASPSDSAPTTGSRAPPAPDVDVDNVVRGAIDPGTHRYKVSYVLANGRETKPSPASAPITIADPPVLQSVDVVLPIGPVPPDTDPGRAVVGRRVYRTVASATGDAGEYLLAGEVAEQHDAVLPRRARRRRARRTARRPAHRQLPLGPEPRPRGHADDPRRAAPRTGSKPRSRAPRPPRVSSTSRVRPRTGRASGGRPTRSPTTSRCASRHCRAGTSGGARPTSTPFRGRSARTGSTGARRNRSSRSAGPFAAAPSGTANRSGAPRSCSRRTPARGAMRRRRCASRSSRSGRRQPISTRRAHAFAARELRYARLDLGALEGEGVHARTDEGVQLDLTLARPGFVPIGQVIRPGRPLRALIERETFDEDGTRSARHTSIRATELPDECHLDLRNSPAEAVGGEYLGLHVDGAVQLSRCSRSKHRRPAPPHRRPTGFASGSRCRTPAPSSTSCARRPRHASMPYRSSPRCPHAIHTGSRPMRRRMNRSVT